MATYKILSVNKTKIRAIYSACSYHPFIEETLSASTSRACLRRKPQPVSKHTSLLGVTNMNQGVCMFMTVCVYIFLLRNNECFMVLETHRTLGDVTQTYPFHSFKKLPAPLISQKNSSFFIQFFFLVHNFVVMFSSIFCIYLFLSFLHPDSQS
jgi:hypothetical protein